MRLLLLSLSVCSLLLLYSLQIQPTAVTVQHAANSEGTIVVSGFAYGGKLCSWSCIKIRGLNATGRVTVTGNVVKKGGEAILFARSIQ